MGFVDQFGRYTSEVECILKGGQSVCVQCSDPHDSLWNMEPVLPTCMLTLSQWTILFLQTLPPKLVDLPGL